MTEAQSTSTETKQTEFQNAKVQQKKQATNTVTTNLAKKFEEMVAKQEKLELEQKQLLKEHKELKNTGTTKHKQADIETQEDKVNKIIEKKFAQFKDEQRTQIEQSDEALRSSIGRSIDQKMDRISVQVAQQVTSQLVELFKQYMSPTKQIETNIPTRERTTPLITQEACTVPMPSKSPIKASSDQNQAETTTTGNNSMIQALSAIDIQSTTPSSSHDNLSERNQMHHDS